MKTILFFLMTLPIAAISQLQGRWQMPDGSIITRANDSTQVEAKGGRIDTFKLEWLTATRYRIRSSTCPPVYVEILSVDRDGNYKAMAYDRKGNRRYFKAMKLAN